MAQTFSHAFIYANTAIAKFKVEQKKRLISLTTKNSSDILFSVWLTQTITAHCNRATKRQAALVSVITA